jgi:cytochrome c oxidase assembly factor CtaG
MIFPAHAHVSLGWAWDPSILLGLALLTAGYALAVGPLRRRYGWGPPVSRGRQAAFYLGNLIVFVALVSPLDALSDDYLFSAHMVQHMLLMFAAPPLWLSGTPGWLVDRLLLGARTRRAFHAVTRPAVAFVIFNLTMWVWHWPRFYDLALEHEGLHIFEHVLFMATAVIGWWPVLGPEIVPGEQERSVSRALYLIPSMFACTALAALIALSPRLLYTFYGAAPLEWGLTPLSDQQIGGLIMWLPGDMIYMAFFIGAVYRLLDAAPDMNLSINGRVNDAT